MEITLNNYEIFAVDYIDGKLNALLTAKFILFLEQHPEVKDELDRLNKFVLPLEAIAFQDKQGLKKRPLQSEYEFSQLLVKKIENDLNIEEERRLQDLIATRKEVKQELELFQKTILSPDLSIVFQHKNSLKRREKGLVYWYYAAAATLILAFVFSFLVKNNTNPIQLSHKGTIKPNKEVSQRPTNKEQKQPLKEYLNNRDENAVQTTLTNKKQKITVPELALLKSQPIKQLKILFKEGRVLSAPPISKITELNSNLPDEIINNRDLAMLRTENNAFLTPEQLVSAKVKESAASVLIEENKPEMKGAQKINKLDVLALAVKAYSKLSGKKAQVKKVYNQQGELAQFALLSGNFEYSKTK